MRPLRQLSARARLARALRKARSSCAAPTTYKPAIPSVNARFLHAQSGARDEDEHVPLIHAIAAPTPVSTTSTSQLGESNGTLLQRISESDATYHSALRAFNELRSRGLKMTESKYLSLMFKASREGRLQCVGDLYSAFLQDEAQGEVQLPPKAATTWLWLSNCRLQMYRFALWALLDDKGETALASFYQREVVGKKNSMGVYEADPFNFLLHLECVGKVDDEQEQGLRLRTETLLNTMEDIKYSTSYSACHALFRLILHRPEIFLEDSADALGDDDDQEPSEDGHNMPAIDPSQNADALVVGNLIIDYMDRFPHALALEPKRLSIAVSAAAAAGHHAAARLILEHGVKHHVPVDAGSFAHAVESSPDDAGRVKIAALYAHAKERGLVYTTENADTSISNYLLYYAVYDGNFKHMMELLHEMQLYNNKVTPRTVREIFKSIAQYRADIRHQVSEGSEVDADRQLAECPNISELFDKFPNVFPRTVHSFSQGILQSLFAGDLAVALDLMRAALWAKDVKLRPEIFSQLLYPLLAGGQRGGGEANDASVFDRLEVERCFDRQYPGQRTHLNTLVLNICQANDDLPTMLVCLDRWQHQRHPPMSRRATQRVFDVISKQIQRLQEEDGAELAPSTAFVVDGMELSFMAFLARYQRIMKWDAWTLGNAIVRAGTRGLQADVVSLLAEADARDLVLESAAYCFSLDVLEAAGEPSAVIACSEKMKKRGVWEKTVSKFPKVGETLSRALAQQPEAAPTDDRL